MDFENTVKVIDNYKNHLSEVINKELITAKDWEFSTDLEFDLANAIIKDSYDDFAIQVAMHILSHYYEKLR